MLKKVYSPSDVHCFGRRLEYPSSVTDFFFLSCSLRSPLKQENRKKFDQKKNVTRVTSKSLYIAYSLHH